MKAGDAVEVAPRGSMDRRVMISKDTGLVWVGSERRSWKSEGRKKRHGKVLTVETVCGRAQGWFGGSRPL
jgi:hypothetical protein